MPILGSTELKTIELPDELQFVYAYQAGWGDIAAPPAALLVAVIWAIHTDHQVFVAIFIAIFAALVFYWLNITPTRLSVTQHQITSYGSHNRNVKAEAIVPTSDLQSLEYLPLSANGASGLYAHCTRKQILLMPAITTEQTAEIAHVIRARFPGLERSAAATSPGFIEPGRGYTSITGIPPTPPNS